MVPGGLPSFAWRDPLIVPRKTSEASFGEAKKQRPLIRYAGSAAETSIGSKPIGSELSAGFYFWRSGCQDIKRRSHSAVAFGQGRLRQPVAQPTGDPPGDLRPAVAMAEDIGQIHPLNASTAPGSSPSSCPTAGLAVTASSPARLQIKPKVCPCFYQGNQGIAILENSS